MAHSPVLSRKDMKEPDQFQVVANRAATWLAARKKKAMLVGGVAVALVLVVGVVAAVQTSRDEAAGRAASTLLGLVAAPVEAQAAEGSTTPSFPTEEAKRHALIAEADKVLSLPGSGSAKLAAALVKGDALYALKDWDKAAAEYQRYLKDAPLEDSFRFGALEGLGLVAEAKGDPDGALAAYQRMARETPRYSDQADIDRARVLAAQGKVEEARKILTGFGTNHDRSTLVRQASEQLARLGAK
jgi:tetratricopeptide (TPR) repeat protein